MQLTPARDGDTGADVQFRVRGGARCSEKLDKSGQSGASSRQRTRLEGFLPPLPARFGTSYQTWGTRVTFRGSFEFTLDAKNRLTIPAKFRGRFGDGVTLARMRDTDGCISVWTTPEFETYVEGLVAAAIRCLRRARRSPASTARNSHDAELDSAAA